LEFIFGGFTLWLMLEETESDITSAITSLAEAVNINPIPIPHVTLFYNVRHESREAALSSFQTFKTKITCWPTFEPPVGCVCDTEFAGVNGGLMDMTWAEISLKSCSNSIVKVKEAKEAFGGASLFQTHHEPNNWKPHLSLGYDNPNDSPLTMHSLVSVLGKYPSLLLKERKVTGIALVDTNGRIGDWAVLDRYEF
jgi:hypothetical protein